LFSASIATSTASFAADAPPPPPPTASTDAAAPPKPAEPDSANEWHRGLFIRAALGFGGLKDNFHFTNVIAFDGTASGGSGAFELSIGGSPKRGLIVGGGIYTETVTHPTITVAGFSAASDIHVGTLGMIGPFIEWYPWLDSGFHFGGALCGARITLTDDSGNVQNESPKGGAIVADVGYEWNLGGAWGLGVMARFTGATLKDGDVEHQVGAASVMLSGTYN
jgi:hypothetical protein